MTNTQIAKLYLATHSTATAAQIDTAVTDGSALTAINALSTADFLEASYQAAFGRSVDADGTAAYTAKLDDATLTKDSFFDILVAGAAAYPADGAFATENAADIAVIPLKAAADAAASGASVGTVAAAVATVVDADTSVAAIATIDAADAVVEAAAAEAATHASTGVIGEVKLMTAGMDTFTTTENDDIFYGIIDEKTTTNNTLSSFDTLNGEDGQDTLNITLIDSAAGAGDANYTGDTTLNSIEKLEVKTSTTKGAIGATKLVGNTVDVDGMDTLTELVDYRSSGKLSFTNIESLDTQITSYKDSSGKKTVAEFKSSVVAGVDDTATFNIEGSSDSTAGHSFQAVSTAAGTGVENLVINSNGSSTNYIDTITSTDSNGTNLLKSVTVNGSANLNITATNGDINFAGSATDAIFNASSATGNVLATFTTGAGSDDITITGGKGNDSFDLQAGLTNKDTIDGSDGVDTIAVKQSGFVLSDYTISNVETIKAQAADGADLSVDVEGNTTVTNVTGIENATASKHIAISNLASGAEAQINLKDDGNDRLNNVTVSLKDPSASDDSLKITLDINSGTSDAGEKIDGTLKVDNVETLTLVSTSSILGAADATKTITVDALTADAMTTLNVEGTQAVVLLQKVCVLCCLVLVGYNSI